MWIERGVILFRCYFISFGNGAEVLFFLVEMF